MYSAVGSTCSSSARFVARNHQLEAGRRHLLGDLGDFGVRRRDDDDPGSHDLGP